MKMRFLTILIATIATNSGCLTIPKKPDTRTTMLNVYKDNMGQIRAYGDSEFKGRRERLDILQMDKNICKPYQDAIKEMDWGIKVLELLKSEIYK